MPTCGCFGAHCFKNTMAECSMNEEEVELSLGLAIGGGRLRKCCDVVVNDDVLRRQEARKKQEVRRGAIRVDGDVEDERMRKKMKSEFLFESGNEGGGSICSSDCRSLAGPRKNPRHIAQVAEAGVKEQTPCGRGLNY